jgi:putative DNA primase/helicase
VRDLELDDRLEAEWPQILRWAIEGALLWQQEGLEPPEAVLAQTQAYFAEEDLPRQWIDASCELAEGPGTEVYMTRPEAFASWRVWCMEQGEEPGKLRDFSKRLRPLEGELGFADGMIGPKDRRRRGWAGIRLACRGTRSCRSSRRRRSAATPSVEGSGSTTARAFRIPSPE